MAIESLKFNFLLPLIAVTEMTDCGRWGCFGPQMQFFSFAPRTEIPTNDIENNLEPVDPEDMEDEDNAGELGESGGMRARPQPRKPST